MSTLDTLQALPRLFRYADLYKFTGNANVFLTRARERGLITRLARGAYLNARLKGEPSLEEAACFIRTPSYISAEWALHLHGIILQAPTVCTVLTLSTAVGVRRNLIWNGVTIEYSHISNRLYFGFETRDGFNLALPKRRCWTPSTIGISFPLADELEIDLVDVDRLRQMSRPFPLRVRTAVERLCSIR